MLAVKTSARGKVPGVVHDSSGSGQTLFVEPFAIVELNNRLAEAASAEREEVERILRELSRLVGERAAELETLVEATGALDLVSRKRGAFTPLARRCGRGSPTACGCSRRAIRCSTRARPCRSTSTSATSACS